MRNRIPVLLLSLLLVLTAGAFALAMAEVQPNHHVTITSCGKAGQFAPHDIIVSCADGNYGFSHLSWMDWGAPTAYAHGTLFVNTCSPNCAAGTYRERSVTIELTDLRNNQYHVLNGVGFNAGVDNAPVALS